MKIIDERAVRVQFVTLTLFQNLSNIINIADEVNCLCVN